LVLVRISDFLIKNRIIIIISIILLLFFFLKKVAIFSNFFNTILFLDKLTASPAKINIFFKLRNLYLEKNFLEILFRKNIFYISYKTIIINQKGSNESSGFSFVNASMYSAGGMLTKIIKQ